MTKPPRQASRRSITPRRHGHAGLCWLPVNFGRSGGADPNRLTRDALGQRTWAGLLGSSLGQRSWALLLGSPSATLADHGPARDRSYPEQEDVVIAIVLTVCLVGDPGTCRDYKITLTPGITLMQCLMTAPPHIAKWSEEHPGWHVERWQCGNASREDI